MSRHFFPTLAAIALLSGTTPAHAQNRQSIGEAFDKKYKPEKKPSPAPGEWSPADRRRLMGEVSGDFYADGLKARKAGRLTEALMLFERVLILDPDNAAARAQVAEIKGKTESAVRSQKASARDATTKLLSKLWAEGESASKNLEWDDAQLVYKKILAIEPANKKARARLEVSETKLFERLKQRGEERERAGDTEGALDAYQLAMVYGTDADVTARVDRLKSRLAESNRKKSDDTYAAALTASQRGNNDRARSLCRQALQLDPNNLQAQRMLERLEKRVR